MLKFQYYLQLSSILLGKMVERMDQMMGRTVGRKVERMERMVGKMVGKTERMGKAVGGQLLTVWIRFVKRGGVREVARDGRRAPSRGNWGPSALHSWKKRRSTP